MIFFGKNHVGNLDKMKRTPKKESFERNFGVECRQGHYRQGNFSSEKNFLFKKLRTLFEAPFAQKRKKKKLNYLEAKKKKKNDIRRCSITFLQPGYCSMSEFYEHVSLFVSVE